MIRSEGITNPELSNSDDLMMMTISNQINKTYVSWPRDQDHVILEVSFDSSRDVARDSGVT